MNNAGPAAIAITGRNHNMIQVARREPRKFVDFSAVPPSQWKMHDRLTNWARASRGGDKQSGEAAPMFALFRSDQVRSREYGAATVVPVDRSDAILIAKGVVALPDKHRRSLQWYYIHPGNPAGAARDLAVTIERLAELVIASRSMLINREV
jgi:hypothetical protein